MLKPKSTNWTVACKNVDRGKALGLSQTGSQRFDIVSFLGKDRAKMTSFTKRQMGQLLAGVTSLIWSGRLCLRNTLTLCSIHGGRYAAMSGTMMDPNSVGSDLVSTGLNNSLTPVSLIREWASTLGIYLSDPDWLAVTIYFHSLWPYRRGH